MAADNRRERQRDRSRAPGSEDAALAAPKPELVPGRVEGVRPGPEASSWHLAPGFAWYSTARPTPAADRGSGGGERRRGRYRLASAAMETHMEYPRDFQVAKIPRRRRRGLVASKRCPECKSEILAPAKEGSRGLANRNQASAQRTTMHESVFIPYFRTEEVFRMYRESPEAGKERLIRSNSYKWK